MPTVLETNLVRSPDVCGGRLRIDGTRVTVNQIVTLYNQGLTPNEIVAEYRERSLQEIYAVIAWYLDNKESFDVELQTEAEAELQVEQQVSGRAK